MIMCNPKEMSVLCYANGFTLWHYNSGEDETVLSHNYFYSVWEMLRVGDIVLCNVKNRTRCEIVVVTASTMSNVRVRVIALSIDAPTALETLLYDIEDEAEGLLQGKRF